jgi:hypothetical protein
MAACTGSVKNAKLKAWFSHTKSCDLTIVGDKVEGPSGLLIDAFGGSQDWSLEVYDQVVKEVEEVGRFGADAQNNLHGCQMRKYPTGSLMLILDSMYNFFNFQSVQAVAGFEPTNLRSLDF